MPLTKQQDREWPFKSQIRLDQYLTAVMDNKGYT
jgi:hypothetical protein